mgnify:CR=1 FL=1
MRTCGVRYHLPNSCQKRKLQCWRAYCLFSYLKKRENKRGITPRAVANRCAFPSAYTISLWMLRFALCRATSASNRLRILLKAPCWVGIWIETLFWGSMLLDSTPLPGLAPLYAQSFNSITWTEGFDLPTAGSGARTVSIACCPPPIIRVYQPPAYYKNVSWWESKQSCECPVLLSSSGP